MIACCSLDELRSLRVEAERAVEEAASLRVTSTMEQGRAEEARTKLHLVSIFYPPERV